MQNRGQWQARRRVSADLVRSTGSLRTVQTRYLIIAALVTALVILGATGAWFIVGLLEG